MIKTYPANIYFSNVTNRNTRKKVLNKLKVNNKNTLKISHQFLVFLLLI